MKQISFVLGNYKRRTIMFKGILLLIAGVILCFIGFELIEYAVTFIVGAMSLILIICGVNHF